LPNVPEIKSTCLKRFCPFIDLFIKANIVIITQTIPKKIKDLINCLVSRRPFIKSKYRLKKKRKNVVTFEKK
jgi:hypothetical protein